MLSVLLLGQTRLLLNRQTLTNIFGNGHLRGISTSILTVAISQSLASLLDGLLSR